MREGLPEHEPFRAWACFELVAEDGSPQEVDLLVLSPAGFFLVEIKSWEGTVSGDASTWSIAGPSGRARTVDSPLLLANRKARKLISLLQRQKAVQRVRLPFLRAVVFLSHKNVRCQLTGTARQGVFLRDRAAGAAGAKWPGSPARPGILAALTRPDAAGAGEGVRIDRPLAKAIALAMKEAGVRATERSKRVGDFTLEELIFAGPNYQDWRGRHASLEKVTKRVRLYSFATSSAAARAEGERAARREFTALDALDHPGLLKPLQYTLSELGPALVFDYDPRAVRLDLFLVGESGRLALHTRLDLVRQVGETLAFVHAKRVYHRALSPQSLLVWNGGPPEGPARATQGAPKRGEPLRLKIFNWQTSARAGTLTSTGALSGTSHLDPLIESAAEVYLAPEALAVADASPEALDVFSLGALAFLIFSGRPPAPSAAALRDLLREERGLELASALDGAHPTLVELIRQATHPVVEERLATVADFLAKLEAVEEAMTRPEERPIDDPTEGKAGDLLPGRFRIKSRLGKGSTAVVYLVERDGKEQVLKVALDAAADARLVAESEVLERLGSLENPWIVKLLGTEAVGDRFGLLLARAGSETLAQRLRDDGRLQLELLERFGGDLLRALVFLERQGVPHRDVKPDNLGVGKVGNELHLVLFDFSLAKTAPESLHAGTRPYLDPFLVERRSRRWDLQAERYAAGVTLYEMATGTTPPWGDGQSDPAMLPPETEAGIEAELLDAAVRAPLVAFFRRALARDPGRRFDNAEEMLAAWSHALSAADRPAATTATAEEQPDELARACAVATWETPVALLHLSTRAENALERAQVGSVGDLLRLPLFRANRLRGVGSKTRKEILGAIHLLSSRLGRPAAPPEQEPAEDGPTVRSLDRLLAELLPASGGRRDATAERRTLEALFGLEPGDASIAGLGRLRWPSQSEVAEALGVTRARVSQVLVKARDRWRRNPSLRALRDDIARLLDRRGEPGDPGGTMTAPELVAALLAHRGSTADEPLRSLRAAACLRAATEVEEGGREARDLSEPRWLHRRSGERLLFAVRPELLDAAEALGRIADELAARDPLPSPQRAFEALQGLWPGEAPPSAERLLRLATGASQRAALSSRLEIYPRGLAADRTLRLASGALLGGQVLTLEELRARVRSRFPEAAALPQRPELDALLLAAGLDLRWDADAGKESGAFRFPLSTSSGPSSATTLDRLRTASLHPGFSSAEPEPKVVDARLFEERLARAARNGGSLVLLVEERWMLEAEKTLAARFPVEPVSLEARWLAAMRALTTKYGAEWSVVLRSDAEPATHPNAQNLRRFAREALATVERELVERPLPERVRTVLLTRVGLLARYGEIGLIERLRERAARRPAPGERQPPGTWVLVATESPSAAPWLDGEAIPVPAPGLWARIPEAWLQNVHRTGERASA